MRKLLDNINPHFKSGGKYEIFYPLYDALDTFLYTPSTTTENGPHVRDFIDLKRSIRSAIYYTTPKNKILFSNNNNIKYLLTSRDWISKKLFIDGDFDFKVLIKAKKLLGIKNSKSTLINVGAHIGSTCIPGIKKNFFKNCLCFEPSKRNFRLSSCKIWGIYSI